MPIYSSLDARPLVVIVGYLRNQCSRPGEGGLSDVIVVPGAALDVERPAHSRGRSLGVGPVREKPDDLIPLAQGIVQFECIHVWN